MVRYASVGIKIKLGSFPCPKDLIGIFLSQQSCQIIIKYCSWLCSSFKEEKTGLKVTLCVHFTLTAVLFSSLAEQNFGHWIRVLFYLSVLTSKIRYFSQGLLRYPITTILYIKFRLFHATFYYFTVVSNLFYQRYLWGSTDTLISYEISLEHRTNLVLNVLLGITHLAFNS